mgnify:CR=1 FL=1
MSVEDSRKADAALRIMASMCEIAMIAAAGPYNPRGEKAVRWWKIMGATANGWDEQRKIVALAVGYAAGHLTKEALEAWKP